MSQYTEQEVQLQFLEEAHDYLNEIETDLLGMSSRNGQSADIDALLRAAHSVKGGAALMGFPELSELAHKLEDSFKVLRARPPQSAIPELEGLLLKALDGMRKVIFYHRQGVELDHAWLRSSVTPIFKRLHQILGDPTPEDENSLMSDEAGEDMVHLLFESEVGGCLDRLDQVLVQPDQPCLVEEVTIAAQELYGLSEMLDLPKFGDLCQSVTQSLKVTEPPTQQMAIAKLAIAEWKRVQSMVLIGQRDAIPSKLDISQILKASPSEKTWTPEPDPWSADLDASSINGDVEAVLELESSLHAGNVLELEDSFDAFDLDPDVLASFTEDVQDISGDQASDLSADDVTPHLSATTDPADESQVASDFITSLNQALQSVEDPIFEGDMGIGGTSEVSVDASLEPSIPSTQEEQTKEDLLSFSDFDDFQFSAEDLSELTSHLTLETAAPTSSIDAAESTLPLADLQEGMAVRPSDSDVSIDPTPVGEAFVEAPAPVRDVVENKPVPNIQPAPEPVVAQTIRVSVQKLQGLGEQFGELVIERNSLRQQLSQMRGLMDRLGDRVNALQRANNRLRTIYDQGAVSRPTPMMAIAGFSGASQPAPSNGFDTLEMDRYDAMHLISQELMETVIQIQEVTSDVNINLEDAEQTTRELSRTTKYLQNSMKQIRMRPISDLLSRVPRVLRDLGLQYGKSVSLSVKGGGTLIDRTLLEQLNDPLIHLVRNAFDHGIESTRTRLAQGKPEEGTIEIAAAYRGNQTVITLRDDGRGVALDKVKAKALKMGVPDEYLAQASEQELLELLFEPGFSTAESVTELSGRGVGMDVVRHNLQKIQGDIAIQTQPGEGTTFTITVPFNLSVVRSLIVESQNSLFAFPTNAVEEIVIPQPGSISNREGQSIFHWEGEDITLHSLGDYLRFPYQPPMVETEASPLINQPVVMLFEQDLQLFALQVDRYWSEQEVTVRQVEGSLPLPPGLSGCTILGDGRIAPLVEVMDLLDQLTTSPTLPQKAAETSDSMGISDEAQASVASVMVVDDSINVRRFLALTLEKFGFRVEQAKDGQHALELLQNGLSVRAVISDLEMPRMDGFGLLSHLKSDTNLKHLPVVMLTSRSGQKHRKIAENLGATAYFSKPFREQQLLETLMDIVAP